MNFRRRRQESREAEDLLLSALVSGDRITRREALGIPSVSACVELVAGIAAMLPVRLYRDQGGRAVEVTGDSRTALLNDEPGGLMDSCQMKKAWITDYLLDGNGYLYIQRERNRVTGLRYLPANTVSAVVSPDPIWKSAEFHIGGATYREFELIKLTRRSQDGITGQGIVVENEKALAAAYNALIYENFLVKTGGNKKGFLKSQKRLESKAIEELRKSFKRLYQNNSENVVVLNNGVEFQEAANTAVELQLNENKKANSLEMCKLFCVPPGLLDGTAGEKEYGLFIKLCIAPLLAAMEAALNKDLLLPSEKQSGEGPLYFAVDTKELLRGDIDKRYAAYEAASRAGWISKNEIRYAEDLPAIPGLDIVTMSLGEILLDAKTGKVFTPNTENVMGSGFNQEKSLLKKGETR